MQKKSILIATLCTALLLAIIISSCRKQAQYVNTDVPIEIQWAKDYYTQTLQPQQGNAVGVDSRQSLNSTDPLSKKMNMKTLFWPRASVGKKSGYDFVEIPIKYTTKTTSTITVKVNGVVTTEEPDADVIRASIDRLVIYKNKSGTIYQKIISYIPDKEYLKRHNGDISHNWLNKLDADFDGYIFHKQWDGKILFILRIQNGKQVKMYNLIKGSNVHTSGKNVVNAMICEDVDVYEWFQYCYYSGDDPNPLWCDPPFSEYAFTEQHCYDDGNVDCTDPAYFGNIQCQGPSPGDPPPSPPDPCSQAAALGSNANFKANMADLKTKTNLSHESGYTIHNGLYTPVTGLNGEASIALNPPLPIDGYIHDHYTGLFPNFSGSDIRAISQLNDAGKINNLSTFTAGVVTAAGTAYMMKISDPAKFATFSAANLTSDTNFTSFENTYTLDVAGYALTHSSIEAYELTLLTLLKDSGIELFKGNSDFTSWDKLQMNNPDNNMTTATITKTNCQ